MLLPIVQFPDPKLRTKSLPVRAEEIANPEFQALIRDMFDTMYAAPGVGLAAVQIGVHKRFMVLDIGIGEGELIKRDPKVVVNPEIVLREGEVIWEEGCLSCPDLLVPVKRSLRVTVKALNEKGEPYEISGEDLLAVALQHEIDHMDGVLIVDKLSRLKMNLYRDKLGKGQRVVR